MELKLPWIDPVEHGLESQLHPNSFHLVYLMHNATDKFCLVTPGEFSIAHSRTNSDFTTNMLAISIEKSDVEGVNSDGRVQTQAIPRVTIQIDSVFVDLDDLVSTARAAYDSHFEFV